MEIQRHLMSGVGIKSSLDCLHFKWAPMLLFFKLLFKCGTKKKEHEGCIYYRLVFVIWNNFFFPEESRRCSRVSPLLRPLTLGLSGRFWLHASLPRFQQIGFLWPWQSLALPLAVILKFLSLMEAGRVSSIHSVTPSAARPHREPTGCPKPKLDAPLAPRYKPTP